MAPLLLDEAGTRLAMTGFASSPQEGNSVSSFTKTCLKPLYVVLTSPSLPSSATSSGVYRVEGNEPPFSAELTGNPLDDFAYNPQAFTFADPSVEPFVVNLKNLVAALNRSAGDEQPTARRALGEVPRKPESGLRLDTLGVAMQQGGYGPFWLSASCRVSLEALQDPTHGQTVMGLAQITNPLEKGGSGQQYVYYSVDGLRALMRPPLGRLAKLLIADRYRPHSFLVIHDGVWPTRESHVQNPVASRFVAENPLAISGVLRTGEFILNMSNYSSLIVSSGLHDPRNFLMTQGWSDATRKQVKAYCIKLKPGGGFFWPDDPMPDPDPVVNAAAKQGVLSADVYTAPVVDHGHQPPDPTAITCYLVNLDSILSSS